MFIQVFAERRQAEVHEVDELRSFSVAVAGEVNDVELGAALEPLGRLESDHAWISIERLRAACHRTGDDQWSADFDAMVAYAGSRGWVDQSGTELRAHVDRAAG